MLACHFLFAVCNIGWSEVTILKFRESLVRSLLYSMLFEKLKSSPTQKSATQSKLKLANHILEEKEGSTRNVGKCCTGCYAKRRAQQSREASCAAAKKVKTFCSDCDKFACLDCFNKKHHAME